MNGGCVYFLQAESGGPIKIGYTVNVPDRLGEIQRMSPVRLGLLGVLDGPPGLERGLHARFKALRAHGEWFRDGPELLTFIREHSRPCPLPAARTASRPVEDSRATAFGRLAQLEPRLLRIYREAVARRPAAGFCANAVWYGYGNNLGGLRERVSRLVGWDRKDHPTLGTEGAYDLAYDTIYDALPDCDHELGGCRG